MGDIGKHDLEMAAKVSNLEVRMDLVESWQSSFGEKVESLIDSNRCLTKAVESSNKKIQALYDEKFNWVKVTRWLSNFRTLLGIIIGIASSIMIFVTFFGEMLGG